MEPTSPDAARLVAACAADWTADLPGAYLAFGETYAGERMRAATVGWPTRTLEVGHLGFLEDPATVRRELLAVIAAMAPTG
ncbi:hypothetical protein J7E25_01415 [Agromyces sp. ISL-38]|uniref:hypothetical protein n=1 Tax=Agromyces sp. ISL-38 TaxID=2819107 RepID=UPI001BE9FFF7|nr:hypothetical protein [Agromyces sp. ISL-38]MBT2497746.1 hypothetical protein [Agromyces sp. ISL-38]